MSVSQSNSAGRFSRKAAIASGGARAEGRHDLLAVLVLDRRLLGGDLERRPHALLGELHSPRRERGDLLGRLERALGERVLRDDVGDEADAQRLLGVERAGP